MRGFKRLDSTTAQWSVGELLRWCSQSCIPQWSLSHKLACAAGILNMKGKGRCRCLLSPMVGEEVNMTVGIFQEVLSNHVNPLVGFVFISHSYSY